MSVPTLTLSDLLPNASSSIDGSGFLFGAGTSLEAGYPLMPDLTRQVIDAFNSDEKTTLEEVLTAAGKVYDAVNATPNIEAISDLVIAHSINSGDSRCAMLEQRLRELIRDAILSVTSPSLDNHCKFFELLKRRAFGLGSTVWIFTTNYDILFELAASEEGVPIVTGFDGALDRFYNPEQFGSVSGTINSGRFTKHNQLRVKLVKLHGSISWFEKSSRLTERHPYGIPQDDSRIMVLPRCKKVIDTLMHPYDSLFGVASKAIQNDCRYLVSCGFGYCDEHITQTLLLPPLVSRRSRLFALSATEPPGVSEMKHFPTFSGGFSTHLIRNGVQEAGSTELWKFSNFVKLFN